MFVWYRDAGYVRYMLVLTLLFARNSQYKWTTFARRNQNQDLMFYCVHCVVATSALMRATQVCAGALDSIRPSYHHTNID